jgi:hypothetical protein
LRKRPNQYPPHPPPFFKLVDLVTFEPEEDSTK